LNAGYQRLVILEGKIPLSVTRINIGGGEIVRSAGYQCINIAVRSIELFLALSLSYL
jgi:hypothetical protein